MSSTRRLVDTARDLERQGFSPVEAWALAVSRVPASPSAVKLGAAIFASLDRSPLDDWALAMIANDALALIDSLDESNARSVVRSGDLVRLAACPDGVPIARDIEERITSVWCR